MPTSSLASKARGRDLRKLADAWQPLYKTLTPEQKQQPDLSVTPFCNTFPIRRTPKGVGESLLLNTAFIDGPALTVARSSQRYDRQGPGRVRYVDLGLSRGFEADLVVDE